MSEEARASGHLVVWTFVVNAVLCIATGAVYFATGSQLVLAQGADSLLDLGAGAILVYTMRIGARERDEDHPFGHQRAEPIGALVTAVLAGVLAFEVLRSAAFELASGSTAHMDSTVAAVLGGKLVVKVALLVRLERARDDRPALEATRVDTRNDIFAGASSLLGYGLARAGFGWADAALALPIALYIGFNGFSLARENLRYLMGEAPDDGTLAELEQLAAAVPGVHGVRSLRAAWHGAELVVSIGILAERDLTLREGHDVSVEVQQRLEGHELVAEVFVHVDPPGGGRPH